jgi:hypothetical protein
MRHDNAVGDADDVNRFAGAIVELVAIAIVDEQIVTRMAFTPVSVEPVVAVRLIAASVFPAD